MKIAKLSIKVLLLLLVFGIAIMINSCKSDGCTDSIALNYNEDAGKDDGSCIYPADKLIGEWSVDETVYSQTNTYNATISRNSNDDIKISAVRNSPPVHFVNDLVLTVKWLELQIAPLGDSLTGTIASENDFQIVYEYGEGAGAYDVTLHYTR